MNQLIFAEVISEIWLIRSNLFFLAIWISSISLTISENLTDSDLESSQLSLKIKNFLKSIHPYLNHV